MSPWLDGFERYLDWKTGRVIFAAEMGRSEGFHDRRLDERLQDPEFRKAYQVELVRQHRCCGLMGRLFGHRFYLRHYWGKQATSYCQRCGRVVA